MAGLDIFFTNDAIAAQFFIDGDVINGIICPDKLQNVEAIIKQRNKLSSKT